MVTLQQLYSSSYIAEDCVFGNVECFTKAIVFRAETTQFIRIFAWLHKYLNTKRVFRYTVDDIFGLILAYFVINYQLKGTLVIT